jgi:hypothetical protein
MRGYMFRNRWFALLFVGLTLAAVTRLVGTEDGKGALGEAAEELVAQKKTAEDVVAGRTQAQTTSNEMAVEFTPDEELIDPAAGEDPTPVDEFAQIAADPAAVPHDEVVIVSREVAEPAPSPAPE